MTETRERLEALFDKVRALPEPQLEVVVDALDALTSESVYRLSDEELSVLLPELEGARRGEFASRAAVEAVLNTPWTGARSS